MSLPARVAAMAAATLLVVTGSLLAMVALRERREQAGIARERLDQGADLVAQFLAGRARTLTGGARVFVQGPYFRTLVTEARRDDLLDQSFEAAEQLGADWVFITDPNGVLLAKSDEPAAAGTAMGQVPLVAGALRGQTMTGFGVSGDTALFQAVAVPIVAGLGAPTGVLVATRLVDVAFLSDVRSATGAELLLYVRDGARASRAPGAGAPETGRARVTAATLASIDSMRSPEVAAALERVVEQARRDDAVTNVRVLGRRFDVRGASFSTAGGEVVGGILVMRPAAMAAVWPALAPTALGALLLTALVSAGAFFGARRWLARPLAAAAVAIRHAGNEEFDEAERALERHDATEPLASAIRVLVDELRDRRALLRLGRRGVQPGAAAAEPHDASPSRSLRIGGSGAASGGVAPLRQPVTRPGILMEPGTVVANRYVIEREVGRGGLGIVYAALDRAIGERIAIKLLRPEAVALDADALERLREELRITRRLSHRNIVRTFDLGQWQGMPFLTMELVDGASLASVIQGTGKLDTHTVVALGKQLLRALAAAHDAGVVHGDLKPHNLLLDARGVLKTADFGVARIVRAGSDGIDRSRDAVALPRLAGAIVGTPEYMAPEQLIGGAPTVRSDLYAAGVVLLECLAGETPYSADTPLAFVARKLGDSGESRSVTAPGLEALGDAARHAERDAQRSGVRRSLQALLAVLMAPDPEARPASARDALARIDAMESNAGE